MAETLRGSCKPDEAIVPSPVPGVYLLPAGHLKSTPHNLLKNDSLKLLLTNLRSSYRYVIVDAPPVLAASEAAVIAATAEGTVLCVMRDVTRAQQLRLTYEKLTATGSRLLGAVVNGVPMQHWTNKYGGYGYASVIEGQIDSL